ncbi:MAG: helix-turn-helix domain-containing protein [Bacteroidales bacterium]|nr:helix-turn-helix domain-containing protein [Bacteroidales bacterium]
MKEELKQYSLDEITDEIVGKVGTEEREQFEFELKLDLLGDIVKQTRLERHLTQEQLGELIGVKKAQISKIENNIKDVRFSTIMKVFNALKAKIKLSVELDNTELNIA